MPADRSRTLLGLAVSLGAAVAIGLSASLPPAAKSATKGAVIDVPIRFTVRDENRSLLDCPAGGGTYRLAGRLVAPASGPGSSATIYVSGVIFSSLFEFHNDLVPGYDYAREMAALGHTSVVIDRVGYGKTVPYPSDGRSVCLGSQADMLHQVIGALRAGRYTANVGSGARTPAFQKIAVAGYSLGGIVAEVEAASFADAQGLLVISWAEQGFTSYSSSIPYVIAHCQPGGPKPPSGLKGYFRTLTPQKVPPLVSAQADPRIKATFAANEELDPCGEFTNGSQWYAGLNRTALAGIKVPVLVVYGDYDVLYNSDAWPAQWAHFTGTRDRTLVGIPDGQMLMLDKHAALTRSMISSWLDNHGL